ncbi:hypothetical protein [Mesorhizobium sp. Mes31]|uniref:hypothetical protein n=1 Tax=Mesorhizobium sp. Mes31 TaxID=2926017 RepID=UPI0021182360|nr:hypothetical protein [Mesorhizobium sp. Mes31]
MANIFDQFDEPTPLPGSPLLRPFKPDEKRPNADGSYSTEISTTWQQPDGQWVNIPSLWMSPQGPKQFDAGDEDGINTAAKNFEQINGPTFKRFPDLASAEAAAKLRSSEGGAAAPAGNVFDQFDEPAAAKSETSAIADMGASFVAGVPRGAIETAMSPITLNRLSNDAAGWVFDKAEGPVRSALGMDPATPGPERDHFKDMLFSPITGLVNSALGAVTGKEADVRSGVYDAQNKAREVMDATLYKPKTTAGKVMGTIGEFVAPGGLPSKMAREAPNLLSKVGRYAEESLGNVVAPAVTSEVAGQATEGTPYEGMMRFLGALFGNAGAATVRSFKAPEAELRRATEGMTDTEWQAAKRLQDNQTGVKLTGPEAIAQATGGASALPNLLRVVEGSVNGRAKTAPFFAARPGQVDSAVGGVLDQIAPQSGQPSSLGPRAANAAERAIAATPEGQELLDAIFGAGPRTTPLQAGQAMQQPLRDVFERRDGMRDALGDRDYAAARAAQPGIEVPGLRPETVAAARPVYSIRPTAGDEAAGEAASMQPTRVDAPPQPIALESRTGQEAIQVDPRPVLRYIDDALSNARGTTADALTTVRNNIMGPHGADTGVTGLDNLRGNINGMISRAVQDGDGQTAEALRNVQGHLDQALESVPEYARAREGFRAASAPLAPFENPAVADVVRRDPYNRSFATPTEKVPGAIDAGGPTAAAAFNGVAPTEARMAYENHLATQILDGVTNAKGAVDGDRLAVALRDNQDMLSQFPAVADRLRRVVDTNAATAPVRAGPLGQVAAAKDTAAAVNAVLPQNPLTGSAQETADAVKRIAQQDPNTAASLVRQNLADRYSKASTETQEGSREFAGAKFRKDVAGNAQRDEILKAVVGALPDGNAASVLPEILNVLQATGRRKQIGSATEFNRTINDSLSGSSPVGALTGLMKSFGASYVKAGDAVKRATLRRNLGTLAGLFIDPASVDLIRAAANASPKINFGEAAGRSGLQVGGTLSDPRGAR